MEINKWRGKRFKNGLMLFIYLKEGFSDKYLDLVMIPSLVVKLRKSVTSDAKTVNIVLSWLVFTIGAELVW